MGKLKLIDEINDAFIDLAFKENSKAYGSYIKAINNELINNVENLTVDKVKSIISNQSLNITDMALLFAIQNTIIELINKPRQAKKNDSVAPILGLLAIYSIAKPKQFAKRVNKIIKGKGLNANEKRARLFIRSFESKNKQVLVKTRNRAVKEIQNSIKKSKISKRMLRDLKQGLKANKSIASIKKGLTKKYNNPNNIKRALQTELHRASELVRQEHSIALGYTHKTWKQNQSPNKRETCFHNGVVNKRIPIESPFRSCGMKAQRPGDDSLPPGETIYCKCYLIFD